MPKEEFDVDAPIGMIGKAFRKNFEERAPDPRYEFVVMGCDEIWSPFSNHLYRSNQAIFPAKGRVLCAFSKEMRPFDVGVIASFAP